MNEIPGPEHQDATFTPLNLPKSGNAVEGAGSEQTLDEQALGLAVSPDYQQLRDGADSKMALVTKIRRHLHNRQVVSDEQNFAMAKQIAELLWDEPRP